MAIEITLKREKFDRERAFEANRLIRCNGVEFVPGQSFDKTLVTTRRLRQMYDNRDLRMSEKQEPENNGIDIDAMSERQLTLLLEDNGIVVRYGKGRDWLVKRAKTFLQETMR